jgi:hypothetical protein
VALKKVQDLSKGDKTPWYEVAHKPLAAIVSPGKNVVLVRVIYNDGGDGIREFDYDQDIEVNDG